MDLISWLLLIVGAVGVGVAIYGWRILVTGRAMCGDEQAFRRREDAGPYYLCFGLALALLASGSLLGLHANATLAVAPAVVAMVLIGFATIRYRPRSKRRR